MGISIYFRLVATPYLSFIVLLFFLSNLKRKNMSKVVKDWSRLVKSGLKINCGLTKSMVLCFYPPINLINYTS